MPPLHGAAQLGLLDAEAPEAGWRVRPSERARRLSVRVLPGGLVEIVVPRGTRPRAIEQFVSHHRGWIERTLDLYRPAGAPSPGVLPERLRFAATGQEWGLQLLAGEGPPRLRAFGATLAIRGSLDRPALLRHLLQRFVMREAHSALAPWLDRLAQQTGLRYERVQVRRQRTRWGSCSRSGTISLNACLMFQPPAVVSYLLVHELAHTRHMNHSRRFWRLVASHEPCWRDLDAALTRGWREVPAWAIC
jgi:predicted metal-dependent hydrolase